MKQLALLLGIFFSFSVAASEDSLLLYLGKTPPGGMYADGIVFRIVPLTADSGTNYVITNYRIRFELGNIRGPYLYRVGMGNELSKRDIQAIERIASGSTLIVTARVLTPGQSVHYARAVYKIP